ncbi:MAG: acyl--CoA ligase, partial [Phaeodactylibacter sp.]|nr:acyl--CoA ligase [Phaeodactylibacter sp.]
MQALQQDWIAKWALFSPDNLAVKDFDTGRAFSYFDLNRLANRLAHALQSDWDIQPGDRIAVLAENNLEWIILFSACQKMNAILVPLNYRLAAAEINYLLENSGPKLLITSANFQEKVDQSPAAQALEQWPLEALSEFCNPELQKPEDRPFPVHPAQEDDPVFILYTSGTTGFPKGALYTHKMLFWNSINTALRLIVNSESRTINVMPPFHTGGWNVLTTPYLHHGGFVGMLN